jgi:hypothetical protein
MNPCDYEWMNGNECKFPRSESPIEIFIKDKMIPHSRITKCPLRYGSDHLWKKIKKNR